MQGRGGSPAGMPTTTPSAQAFQNKLPVPPGPAPAHLQHPANSNPSRTPSDAPLKGGEAGAAAPSAGLQGPVTNQMTSTHNTGSANGGSMSHSGQSLPGSSSHTIHLYGNRNGMPFGPYAGSSGQQVNPYTVAGNSQGVGSYGGGPTYPYTGAGPRSAPAGLSNGMPPVQSGAGLQTSVQPPQRQPSVPSDDQHRLAAAATHTHPGPHASAEGIITKSGDATVGPQVANQPAGATDMPVKSALGTADDGTERTTSGQAKDNGVQLSGTVQENNEGELDVLADGPQLIEPPMIAGPEAFSDGLFAE